MVYCVVSIKDLVTGLFSAPMTFQNEDLAYVSIRRWTRDSYERKEISLDQLLEQQVAFIGAFDTENGALLSFDEDKYELIDMYSFVKDLVESEDDEVSD